MKPSPAVSLLLTTLRLLDYDQASPDAFPISAAVFTSLTNKGKAFEHIAHHLFRCLDPAECDLRFQGCWPVYEPAQARELRNAAFKWLNDLKAVGYFRGVIIRRTTLDDCNGERYEELLLSLATMVLKEKIERGMFENVLHTQAYIEATSATPSVKAVQALLWAHQNAITRLLDHRAVSKGEWTSFAEYLGEKEKDIADLAQHVAEWSAEPEEPLPGKKNAYEESIRSKWRNNWLGDPVWLEILLNGDPELSRDRFLELPFETALAKHRHFKDGKILSGGGAASLAGLERQVAEQRKRVDELRKLREEALVPIPGLEKKPTAPTEAQKERSEKPGLKVAFNKHGDLHLKNAVQAPPVQHIANNYTELLSSLRDELASADATTRRVREKSNILQQSFQEPEQIFAAPELEESYIEQEYSQMSIDMPDADYSVSHDGSSQHPEDGVHEKEAEDNIVEDEPELEQDQGDLSISPAASDPDGESNSREDFLRVAIEPPVPIQRNSRSPIRNSFESSDENQATKQSPEEPTRRSTRNSFGLGLGFTDDELYAEQMVANIANASATPDRPSPVKRAHFARALSPIYSPGSPSFALEADSPLPGGFHTDPSPHHLGTPTPAPARSVTPTEELLASEDYNSVFKSRPKIATSPLFTPTPAGGKFGVVGRRYDVDDMDVDVDTLSAEEFSDDEAMSIITSPLRGRR